MRNKVLLIVAVFLMAFAAAPALAQSIAKAPGGNTNPGGSANPPAGTANQSTTASANTPGVNNNPPAGSTTSKVTSSNTSGGNTSPPEVNDKPPTITIKTPANGATYKEAEPITADYECKNADGTGFAVGGGKCVGNVGSGILMDTSTPGDYTFTVKATGDNGKQAVLTYRYTVEDVKPQITIKTPEDNAVYDNTDRPKADYRCQNDDGSALTGAGCLGPKMDGEPLDMTPGEHSFTVKAKDNYGRQAELTYHYTVKDSPGDGGGTGGSGGGGSSNGGGSSGDGSGGNSGGGGGNDPSGGGGGGNDPGGGGGSGGSGNSTNVGGVIGSIGNVTYNVIGSIGNVPNNVAGSVIDTATGLTQGKLPDTGGGWTVLLFAGTALVGGGWFLVRRFSR